MPIMMVLIIRNYLNYVYCLYILYSIKYKQIHICTARVCNFIYMYVYTFCVYDHSDPMCNRIIALSMFLITGIPVYSDQGSANNYK